MYKTANEIMDRGGGGGGGGGGGRAGVLTLLLLRLSCLGLQMAWTMYEFRYWKVTKRWNSNDLLWNNYIPRDIYIGINTSL